MKKPYRNKLSDWLIFLKSLKTLVARAGHVINMMRENTIVTRIPFITKPVISQNLLNKEQILYFQ